MKLIIKFYNNIYASAYRSYDRYEESPRLKTASFIFVCLLGLFGMMLGIIRNLLNYNFLKNQTWFTTTLVLTGFIFLGMLWKYYSKEKVESIIIEFERKALNERKLWGYIAVVSFVLPWIIFAFLLSNPQN